MSCEQYSSQFLDSEVFWDSWVFAPSLSSTAQFLSSQLLDSSRDIPERPEAPVVLTACAAVSRGIASVAAEMVYIVLDEDVLVANEHLSVALAGSGMVGVAVAVVVGTAWCGAWHRYQELEPAEEAFAAARVGLAPSDFAALGPADLDEEHLEYPSCWGLLLHLLARDQPANAMKTWYCELRT